MKFLTPPHCGIFVKWMEVGMAGEMLLTPGEGRKSYFPRVPVSHPGPQLPPQLFSTQSKRKRPALQPRENLTLSQGPQTYCFLVSELLGRIPEKQTAQEYRVIGESCFFLVLKPDLGTACHDFSLPSNSWSMHSFIHHSPISPTNHPSLHPSIRPSVH